MSTPYGTCRGCRFPDVLVDKNGICHDCFLGLSTDPDLTVDDLSGVMPGPEYIRSLRDGGSS